MSNLRVGYSAKFFKHIPSDWGLIELKKLVKPDRKITYGIVQPGQYAPNGILLIRGQDYMTGWAERGSFFKVSPALHQKFKRSTTRSGDVLISIAGYTGTVAVVPSWIQEANLTQTTARICCKPDLMDGLYLSYFLQSDDGKLQSKRYTKGSAQEGLNLEDVEKFLISVPPLPEQQKIATILSSVDDVIEKIRAQIDKLKDLKTGMMQELLTKGIGHTEFKDSPVGRIPAEWEVVTLEQICDPNAPITYGVLKPGNYVDGGRPLLQIKDLGEGTILAGGLHLIDDDLDYEYRRSRVQFGDIVISLVGTIGRTAMIPCWLNQPNIHRNLGRIRTRHNQYVFQFLQSESAKLQLGLTSAGSSQSALNLSALRQMSLPLPSPDEAQEITRILSSVDERIKVTTSRLNQLNNVKRALMQDLLTGKVRVKLTDKESAAV